MKYIDLSGRRFGRLIVISASYMKSNKRFYTVKCDCGNIKEARADSLLSNHTTSCGCYHKEASSIRLTKRLTKHGLWGIPEYHSWNSMIDRCQNPNNPQYKDYGGRGIIITDRWRGEHGFENFIEDMGFRPFPKHSIDRYPDNNGNYFKENCRWATEEQQKRNTRRNKWFILRGERILQKDLISRYNMTLSALKKRISKGYAVEDIVLAYERKALLGLKMVNTRQ